MPAKIYVFGKVNKLLLQLNEDVIILFSSPQLQYYFVLSIVGRVYRKTFYCLIITPSHISQETAVSLGLRESFRNLGITDIKNMVVTHTILFYYILRNIS